MTVLVKAIRDGVRAKAYQFLNDEGTTETGVLKLDISSLTDAFGNTATYSAIDRIDYNIGGYNYVELLWDHTADDVITVLRGYGSTDWTLDGGNNDPRSAGGTGDILLTTNGGAAGSSYDITLWLRPKS